MSELLSPVIAAFDLEDSRSALGESTVESVETIQQLDGILVAAMQTPIFTHEGSKISPEEARDIVHGLETIAALEQIASSLLGKRISIFDSTGWLLAHNETVTGYSIFEKGIVFYFPKRMGDYGDGFVKFTLGQGMKVVRSESKSS